MLEMQTKSTNMWSVITMGTFNFSGAPIIMVMIRGFFFLYNTHFLYFVHFFPLLFADVADVFTTWHEVLLVFLLYVQSHQLLRNIFILTCEVCTIFIMLVFASLALNKSCVATGLTAGLLFTLKFSCHIKQSWVAGAEIMAEAVRLSRPDWPPPYIHQLTDVEKAHFFRKSQK